MKIKKKIRAFHYEQIILFQFVHMRFGVSLTQALRCAHCMLFPSARYLVLFANTFNEICFTGRLVNSNHILNTQQNYSRTNVNFMLQTNSNINENSVTHRHGHTSPYFHKFELDLWKWCWIGQSAYFEWFGSEMHFNGRFILMANNFAQEWNVLYEQT